MIEFERVSRRFGDHDALRNLNLTLEKGEMVFTPPMVDHGMKFPVDTVFLTLSRNYRDQEAYESDVVRVEMISPKNLTSWIPKDNKKR